MAFIEEGNSHGIQRSPKILKTLTEKLNNRPQTVRGLKNRWPLAFLGEQRCILGNLAFK